MKRRISTTVLVTMAATWFAKWGQNECSTFADFLDYMVDEDIFSEDDARRVRAYVRQKLEEVNQKAGDL